MKERRRNPGLTGVQRTWTRIWLIILVLGVALWASENWAQYYDRDAYSEPYPGWHSDMYREEQRQTELMEMQEDRARRQEIQDSGDRARERIQRYHQRLRDGARW